MCLNFALTQTFNDVGLGEITEVDASFENGLQSTKDMDQKAVQVHNSQCIQSLSVGDSVMQLRMDPSDSRSSIQDVDQKQVSGAPSNRSSITGNNDIAHPTINLMIESNGRDDLNFICQ